MITKKLNKVSTTILTSLLVLNTIFINISAVNEEFDNDNDSIVSQNEAIYALLEEQPSDSPVINGKSYALYDTSSKAFILGANIDDQLEPASITKVMTCLLALQSLNLDSIVTITQPMIDNIPDDYVKLGLIVGEEVTVKDLIYSAMLKSCNDAALALGVYMGGSESEFCKQMNTKANEIGCTHTNFTTAYGFADPANLTTSHDMCLILEEALNCPEFSNISTTYQYTINPTNKYTDSRTITNTNRFIATQELGYDYYIGGKTGYTDTAGNTLCSAATKNDRTLIGVILGSTSSDQRYYDMISLFDYGYANYTTIAIDENEFTSAYSTTLTRFEESLINTNLIVENSSISLSSYLTVPSKRASLGNTISVELSGVNVDLSQSEQSFNIPLYKTFADDRTYIVGSIKVNIRAKDRLVNINPEKKTIWTTIKRILITIIAVLILIILLIVAMYIFLNKTRKRKDREFNKKSRVL